MDKTKLIEEINNNKETPLKNRMGCSENWYDPVYAMKRTFTIEEIKNMTEKEIQDLLKLANNIQDGLF
jgi:lysyl-tRNA synthetase class I